MSGFRRMRLGWVAAGGGVATLAASITALPVLMFIVLANGSQAAAGCVSSGTSSITPRALSASQLQNAATIQSVGTSMQIPPKGIVIALAAAYTESGFRNYANDGTGQLSLFQFGVSDSMTYPHEAVGHDHGSLGLFQQQWPWWGSIPDLMTPTVAARKFYAALVAVSGWQDMPEGEVAQAVEKSAYPTRYRDAVPLAERLVADSGAPPHTPASNNVIDAGGCTAAPADPGANHLPLPANSYKDLQNFGAVGPRWTNGHTGTDLAAACGTPVLAATNGQIIVRTDQAWAGAWLIEVSTGTGSFTTWYAHMRTVTVNDGQSVQAGEQIGEVGDLGNADGCHLHFEVHPHGGGFGEDPVDPTPWLAGAVGGAQPHAPSSSAAVTQTPTAATP